MYAVSDSWNLIHSCELREFIQVLEEQPLWGILGEHTHTCILSFFVSLSRDSVSWNGPGRRSLLVLSCCREEQCLGQGTGKGSSAAESSICCCQGCKSALLEWGAPDVCSRFKGPGWILFTCWWYPLGGKRVNTNAEFGQVGRPLEAVQIPVLLSVVLDFWRWSVSLVHVLHGLSGL